MSANESQGEFLHPRQHISGASQQNVITAFSSTAEDAEDLSLKHSKSSVHLIQSN